MWGVLWMAWSRSYLGGGYELGGVALLGVGSDALQLAANLLFLLRDGTPSWVSGGDAGGLPSYAGENATEVLLRGTEAVVEGSAIGAAEVLAAACGNVASLSYGESLGLLLTVTCDTTRDARRYEATALSTTAPPPPKPRGRRRHGGGDGGCDGGRAVACHVRGCGSCHRVRGGATRRGDATCGDGLAAAQAT